jgi:Ni2+-binding GTPase involved in maturation of urease and hydrogenase
MDWHELEKTKVAQLREMAKEKLGLEGTIGMTKEHLVEALAKALNIEKPHKVVHGAQKTRVKQEIRALKAVRVEAIEKGDRTALARARQKIHRLRRDLRKMATVEG